MIDELRRQRVLRVIRAFTKDREPGTPLTARELDAYCQRLREARATASVGQEG